MKKTTIIVLALIIGVLGYIEFTRQTPSTVQLAQQNTAASSTKALMYPAAVELQGIAGYINTDGKNISLQEHIGKEVILLDIWTYSCINCQRTFPYVKMWHEKYHDQGLLIIGVHTPEFEFEKDYNNVLAAVQKFGIQYPVVLDNDYKTWRAYNNQYWPRKYLIDIDGFVVYDHIGEGGYEDTALEIQKLLQERSRVLGLNETMNATISMPEAADLRGIGSPEVYFGAARNQYLATGAGIVGVHTFRAEQPRLNQLQLDGVWNVQPEFAVSQSNVSILFRYRSRNVYFVASAEPATSVSVLVDGMPVGKRSGADVRSDGTVLIAEPRLYNVIADSESSEHTLELRTSAGLKAFTFTFG